MKKISNKQRLWAEKCHKRHITKIENKNKKKKRLKRKRCKKKTCWWDICINAPEIISIYKQENRRVYLRFLNKIQKAVNEDHSTIRINFKKTRMIIADAGILLRANLSTLVARKNKRTILKCAPSKSSKINEVLTQIRILELFNQDFNITPNHEDVVHWNLAEGHGADGEKYEEILGKYDGNLTPKLLESFYLGLTEAMTNTRQHAYPEEALTCWSCPGH